MKKISLKKVQLSELALFPVISKSELKRISGGGCNSSGGSISCVCSWSGGGGSFN